jgi:hypothetical protein
MYELLNLISSIVNRRYSITHYVMKKIIPKLCIAHISSHGQFSVDRSLDCHSQIGHTLRKKGDENVVVRFRTGNNSNGSRSSHYLEYILPDRETGRISSKIFRHAGSIEAADARLRELSTGYAQFLVDKESEKQMFIP